MGLPVGGKKNTCEASLKLEKGWHAKWPIGEAIDTFLNHPEVTSKIYYAETVANHTILGFYMETGSRFHVWPENGKWLGSEDAVWNTSTRKYEDHHDYEWLSLDDAVDQLDKWTNR
jgi:hypothetical protein